MIEFLQKKELKNLQIIDQKSTFIEVGASVGEGTIIYPNNYIKNGAKIGKNCIIYPNNFIEECVIGDNCSLGPCCHIRPKCEIGENVKIGNFCEIKASFVGDRRKISHLSYIGDAILGKSCNVGCGVITANFNGKIKQKTIVGDGCFLGCNSNLIAPLKIENNCFICAGATVESDLKSDSFVLPKRENFITKRGKKND